MRDNLEIVKALLSKTVARGATIGEEAAAIAKAVEIMGRHHLPHSAVASLWPKGLDYHGKRTEPRVREETGAVKSTGSIGNYARHLLMRDIVGLGPYGYEWIIEAIKIKFPNAKTTVASLRWYESELRKQGRTVPAKRPAI